MGKEVRYKRSEEEEPNVEESKGQVSDAEVESVMKLLVTYQKARAEGIAPPNPELDVRPHSIIKVCGFWAISLLYFFCNDSCFSPTIVVISEVKGAYGRRKNRTFLDVVMVIGSACLLIS